METKRLFDENVMQRECEAVVVRTEPYHEGYAVVFDQTVFFPEGGGQLSDTGTLTAGEKALPVKHVHEKAGQIYLRQSAGSGTIHPSENLGDGLHRRSPWRPARR